jgi:hypothetical protein
MRILQQNNREPIGGASTSASALTNHACNVTITVQMEGYPPITAVLENEAEARNLLARFAPTAIITSNPESILPYLTDDTNPLFELMLATAKQKGLSLPAIAG